MLAPRSFLATILLVTVSGQSTAATPSRPEAVCPAELLETLFAPSLIDELTVSSAPAVLSEVAPASRDPRRTLVDFAMQLRDIRYRRGGRLPATGFDCSGFVHYVFANVLGLDLPSDSASQFTNGNEIARAEMQAGDLVFFRTHGKRVSHVGIYLGDGRFIHAPTTGQRVRVNRLDESYWAQRFAGARRPQRVISPQSV
jgi:cell wall-associated NlpC family hydrolase